ncbi:hypothetical protein [Alishewanella phage vB_AspM_Slicko01]|nr:hypothetical protein [Alishewanella phage vB_AspM_Slicko01]
MSNTWINKIKKIRDTLHKCSIGKQPPKETLASHIKILDNYIEHGYGHSKKKTKTPEIDAICLNSHILYIEELENRVALLEDLCDDYSKHVADLHDPVYWLSL